MNKVNLCIRIIPRRKEEECWDTPDLKDGEEWNVEAELMWALQASC